MICKKEYLNYMPIAVKKRCDQSEMKYFKSQMLIQNPVFYARKLNSEQHCNSVEKIKHAEDQLLTKSNIVFARLFKVTETLFKWELFNDDSLMMSTFKTIGAN